MNVLYITVDALRADHVTKSVMPTIHDFANDGLEYTRCYANGPGTPWSFPSLLAGRYSGGTDGFGIPDENDPRPTLAEALNKEGYATAGFTDNRFASSDYNYDRGMESMYDANATSSEKRIKQVVRERLDHDGLLYQSLLRSYHLIDDLLVNVSGRETRFVRAEILVNRLLDWVDNQDEEWFAWLHPMDVHAPYEAPDEYQRKYLDDPVSRRRTQELARKATHHPDELSDDEWKLQRRLYKAECTYLDDQLERLFDSLPKSVLEETLIVFTADHGEMHGEHGLGGHPQQFWEEVIHVPCAISGPDLGTDVIDDQIGLVDLPPTILEALGIDQPTGWDGHNILPTEDGTVDEREHVFVDVKPELDRDHVGVRRADEWKLMRHNEEGEILVNTNDNPKEDPLQDQSNNVSTIYQELSDILDEHLDEMEQRRREDVTGIEDEEMIEDHLRELGYLE
ncbi:sulfatase [Halopiger aswanensis]|uniref:Arylsulfatase A-like enzyme n=1 Tax=Halopiger aswanensis TaxID=148449 RepID=A0A419WRJ9_9EURY|nr:sulfatase [Halopiger aswanensis]RKD98089.1 arylsulfatase A-like enzyme [Halopiger aswanensis]